uniref:tRNA (adenine(58)-N(1))-methyltransferase catalytic subunit TRM61 n=1 Tax=Bionectria ochroleuca TaxID=29856 RepID=A0A0B7K217_BIOOC
MRVPATSQCLRQAVHRVAPQRRWFTCDRLIQEHDVVLLRQRGDKRAKWKLTPALRDDESHRIKLSYGAHVRAQDLIGKRYLDTVTDSAGREVAIHEASMASYIVNSERMATPIYPQDCSVIVSMLDLNPERPGENDDGPDGDGEVFEVFEAGTGMGSLTMHIARALHAANPPLRKDLRDAPAESVPRDENEVLPSTDSELATPEPDYLTPRLASSLGVPFLSRAVLDLPSPESFADPVVRALKPNGLLVVFNPSISQIADFAKNAASEGEIVQVMRPRVGDRVVGGGFVAVFRRLKPMDGVEEEEKVEEEKVEEE